MPIADDLRKEEYLSLRKETESQMAELALLERNCVFAAAAVYAWLFAAESNWKVPNAAWNIPLLVTFFGALRSLSIGKHITAIGDYVQHIEETYFTERGKPKGWEHFLHPSEQKLKLRTAITVSFWIALLAMTLCIAWMKGPRPWPFG